MSYPLRFVAHANQHPAIALLKEWRDAEHVAISMETTVARKALAFFKGMGPPPSQQERDAAAELRASAEQKFADALAKLSPVAVLSHAVEANFRGHAASDEPANDH
jgi:predicted dienelactone hydrolase